jgi:hypothetical protein
MLARLDSMLLGSVSMSEALRHVCRNPRCGGRLKEPTWNTREAFCCRGCHRQFYDKRCMACERLMERKTGNQRICDRRKCRNEFATLKAHNVLGRYIVPAAPVLTPETSISIGSAEAPNTGRAWRLVAGPEPHWRTCTPLDRETANRNARVNRGYWNDDTGKVIKRNSAPINVICGYRFPNTSAVILADLPVTIELESETL